MTLSKKVTISITAAILTLAFALLLVTENVYGQQPTQTVVSTLQNVRAYTAAVTPGGASFAVDQGLLYTGEPGNWQLVETPDSLIVNAVAVDSQRPQTVVIGAGDRSVLYISRDGGASWQKVALESEIPSGITSLTIDSANRLIYAGTFTNGVYRLRDVGSSVIAAGHLLLDEPVQQVVADSTGTGMAFVRTEWNLYRAEELGLRWQLIDNLPSPATAIVIAGTPSTAYVGTASSGVVKSSDGITWQSANQGLGYTPGSQLYISALANDPLQPNVIYAATNLIFGSANAHITPVALAMSYDAGGNWQSTDGTLDAVLTDLMPVAGMTGAVYGLSERSRTPLALGETTRPVVAQPVMEPVTAAPMEALELWRVIAWVVAGLSTTALTLLVAYDVWQDVRRRKEEEARLAARFPHARRLRQSGPYGV
ncbi:MAG: exo-alpha-sialidase [Caldilineaceae bacterium]|nr:exo-alpha-sialidase [Caldilineaceae bacterium]